MATTTTPDPETIRAALKQKQKIQDDAFLALLKRAWQKTANYNQEYDQPYPLQLTIPAGSSTAMDLQAPESGDLDIIGFNIGYIPDQTTGLSNISMTIKNPTVHGDLIKGFAPVELLATPGRMTDGVRFGHFPFSIYVPAKQIITFEAQNTASEDRDLYILVLARVCLPVAGIKNGSIPV